MVQGEGGGGEMNVVVVHGVAGQIRTSEESDTFDFANQSITTIATTIEAAFKEPFPYRTDMIRLTFIIGAGKQARQMYDPKAAHAVTSTLQNICGFVEDRGSSCIIECAGTYKLQHDTGKNLKTVVVFPKIATTTSMMDDEEEGTDGQTGGKKKKKKEPPLVAKNTPEYKLAVATMSVFDTMIQSKCTTWNQKRNCIIALDSIQEIITKLDTELLMKGIPLSETQQELYDAVTQLEKKRHQIHLAMSQQVEQGQLTASELDWLQHQNATKIKQQQQQQQDKSSSTSSTALLQRKEVLDSITTPLSIPKLKHHAALGKLYKELGPLLQLELETRGRLLSVKETQAISRKDELQDEIHHLEQTSREWFEDDTIFNERIQISRKEFARFLPKGSGGTGTGKNSSSSSKLASSSGGGGGGSTKTTLIGSSTKTRVPVNKWVVPIKGTGKAAKKKKKLQKGDVFGAMMMDSDDSSEEEDDDDDDNDDDDEVDNDEEEEEGTQTKKGGNAATSSSNNNNNKSGGGGGNKKKNKKKKKKGTKKGTTNNKDDNDDDDDLILSRATTTNTTKEDDSNDSSTTTTAVVQVISLVQNHILPLLMALLGWIISLIFGSLNNKKKKRKNE